MASVSTFVSTVRGNTLTLNYDWLMEWPLECLYNTKPLQKKGDDKGNHGALQNRLLWEEDLAALVPVSLSGSGPEAEQRALKMHVSSLIWAVSFGSASSLFKSTRMALHDLV